jgi:hypothetical protein
MDRIHTIFEIADDFQSQYYIDEFRSRNGKVEIYFDTHDVQDMIQGLRSIEGVHEINLARFNSDKLWVQAFAFLKKIGQIKMLPPHQDEIANYISNRYLLPSPVDLDLNNLTNDLFKAVGLSVFYNKPEQFGVDQIKQQITLIKDKAITLYKANHLIYKPFWLDRLKYLFNYQDPDSSIISINDKTYDIVSTTNNETFIKLHQYFNKKREHKKPQNFRDALALTLLSEKLQEYIKDNSKPIPIFYSTSSTIDLINNNKQLRSLFCFSFSKGQRQFSILRGHMFFILDVVFNLEDKYSKEYKDLFTRIRNLKNSIARGNPDLFNEADYHTQLQTILESQFFISFWFDNMVEEQFSESILKLINYDLVSKNTKLINAERIELGSKISSNLETLRLVEKAWNAFDNIDEFIEKKINKNKNEFDVFIDFGLTRFSFTRCQEIQLIINDLIRLYRDDKASNDYYLIKSQIIKSLSKGVFKSDLEELLIPISIFWVFEEYVIIDQTLTKLDLKYEHYYQLAIIHVAALVKLDRNKNKINKILKCIESKSIIKNNYKPFIGLSYIYYHIWKNEYDPIISYEVENYKYENTPEIIKAIEYINKAIFWLEKNKDQLDISEKKRNYRNRKYYYSLNNQLYYQIRSVRHIDFNKIETLIAKLELSFDKAKGKFWQPRFSHTLALTYLRFAYMDKEKKEKYFPIANMWIKRSLETMPTYKEDYTRLKEKIELG